MASFLSSRPSSTALNAVTLNIYNVARPANFLSRALSSWSTSAGVGVHHTSIHVGGYRYEFDPEGVKVRGAALRRHVWGLVLQRSQKSNVVVAKLGAAASPWKAGRVASL